MRELKEVRLELDQVDRQIVALFERRMTLGLEVARCKAQAGLAVLDPQREKQVLESRAAFLRDPAWRPQLETLYQTLMALSREAQARYLEGGGAG